MASSYCSVCSGDALDASYYQAKVVSAAGRALGVRVSAESMQIEPPAVDLDIFRTDLRTTPRWEPPWCEGPDRVSCINRVLEVCRGP